MSESKQVEWRDSRHLRDSASEEGEAEVSSEVEVEAVSFCVKRVQS